MTVTVTRRMPAALAALALAAIVAGCAGSTATPSPAQPSPAQPSLDQPSVDPAPTSAGSGCPTAPPDPLPAGETRTVTIETAEGSIVIVVEADLGPRAAGNFVALADCGFYDGVVFHRLMPGFVIQGGDPTGTGGGGPGYEFPNDPVSVSYDRGVVAMANAGVDTNGSQFFIVLVDNDLTPNYSVFGRVTAGMEVVDAIAAGPNTGGQEGRALEPVTMDRVTVANP
jgi:cyclophilin family peptidyl-prolyl cis-trans isomerase